MVQSTRDSLQPAQRVAVVCCICLSFSALITLALGFAVPSAQVFAAYGLMKKIVLPLIYCVTFAVMLRPLPSGSRVRVPPLWWWVLAISLTAGLAWSLFEGQAPSFTAFGQDVLLVGGFLIQFHFAASVPHWTTRASTLLIGSILIGGLIGLLMSYQIGPYTAISPPAALGLIYIGLRYKKQRLMCVAVGVAAAATMTIRVLTDPLASMAVMGGLGACVGILVISLAPRWMRRPLLLLGLAALLAFLQVDGTISLMRGFYQDVDDVTLAQRGFESHAVFLATDGPTAEPLLGLGPGGTVDLLGCPDADTLVAAGRDLRAVDDVHLLTSWVMMKFGAVGWLWLALLLGSLISTVWRFASYSRPAALEVIMAMCACCGVMSALPAATNFFSNPLMPLSLGVLWSLKPLQTTSRRPDW